MNVIVIMNDVEGCNHILLQPTVSIHGHGEMQTSYPMSPIFCFHFPGSPNFMAI
jgi:hypothetical protein